MKKSSHAYLHQYDSLETAWDEHVVLKARLPQPFKPKFIPGLTDFALQVCFPNYLVPTAIFEKMPRGGAMTNEYFIPRDGIDREVIVTDICRYLGNDALVRPGKYEVELNVLSCDTVANLL
jgi:hypothetical protein